MAALLDFPSYFGLVPGPREATMTTMGDVE
jgi:hypothetical protein